MTTVGVIFTQKAEVSAASASSRLKLMIPRQ